VDTRYSARWAASRARLCDDAVQLYVAVTARWQRFLHGLLINDPALAAWWIAECHYWQQPPLLAFQVRSGGVLLVLDLTILGQHLTTAGIAALRRWFVDPQ
jgi:hypothetical protein